MNVKVGKPLRLQASLRERHERAEICVSRQVALSSLLGILIKFLKYVRISCLFYDAG